MSESLIKTKTNDPLILDLLHNIRGHRSMLENLEPIIIDPNISTIESEEPGKELFIQNEFHRARGFRKLHIEVAEFSKNIKILHCVFFPNPKFDIPIFGMDLVKINDIVSAAIVDLSPVSKNQLTKYEKLLPKVDKKSFTSMRQIPSWGEIFSNNVFFASLKTEPEKNAFSKLVDQYLATLVQLSRDTVHDLDNKIVQERVQYQKNYCIQQMKNEKTSMVLLKYFDEKWVKDYIKNVLFDFS